MNKIPDLGDKKRLRCYYFDPSDLTFHHCFKRNCFPYETLSLQLHILYTHGHIHWENKNLSDDADFENCIECWLQADTSPKSEYPAAVVQNVKNGLNFGQLEAKIRQRSPKIFQKHQFLQKVETINNLDTRKSYGS